MAPAFSLLCHARRMAGCSPFSSRRLARKAAFSLMPQHISAGRTSGSPAEALRGIGPGRCAVSCVIAPIRLMSSTQASRPRATILFPVQGPGSMATERLGQVLDCCAGGKGQCKVESERRTTKSCVWQLCLFKLYVHSAGCRTCEHCHCLAFRLRQFSWTFSFASTHLCTWQQSSRVLKRLVGCRWGGSAKWVS